MKNAEQSKAVVPAQRSDNGGTRALPILPRILLAAGVAVALLGGSVSWATLEITKVDVPDLMGIPAGEAAEIALASRLFVDSKKTLPSENLREFTVVTSQDPAPGDRAFPGETITFDYEFLQVSVPKISGLTLGAARKQLEKVGLWLVAPSARIVYEESSSGVEGIPRSANPVSLEAAISQLDIPKVELDGGAFDIDQGVDRADWLVDYVNVTEGTTLKAGSTVEVTLAVPLAQVPDVTGRSSAEAAALIHDAGLRSNKLKQVFDGPLPAEFHLDHTVLRQSYWGLDEVDFMENTVAPDSWTVSTQSIAAGTIALRWETVVLQPVWPSAIVPDLVGMTGSKARLALHDAGLSWRYVASGLKVESQSVPAGTVVPMGSRISASVGRETILSVTSSASTGLIEFIPPVEARYHVINPAALPWRTTWYPASVQDVVNAGRITARMFSDDEGWIACEIIEDGVIVESKKSTGKGVSVTCG